MPSSASAPATSSPRSIRCRADQFWGCLTEPTVDYLRYGVTVTLRGAKGLTGMPDCLTEFIVLPRRGPERRWLAASRTESRTAG
jgi:hypothetical protein